MFLRNKSHFLLGRKFRHKSHPIHLYCVCGHTCALTHVRWWRRGPVQCLRLWCNCDIYCTSRWLGQNLQGGDRGRSQTWLTPWHKRCVRFCSKPLTQCVTWFVLPWADIEACEENSVIVSLGIFTHQPWLPLTETVQGLISMVRDGETQLIQTARDRKNKRIN